MIDPQARDRSAPDQLEEQPMRLVKNLRQLHPDGREIVHVEKAPVIDLLRRDPPEREAIRLIAEECIERIETARIARRPVDDREGFFDRFLHRGASWQRRSSRRLITSFSRARSAMRSGSVSVRRGKIFQRGQNALQFRVIIFLFVLVQLIERDLQNVTVGARRDRKFMFEIAQEKAAGIVVHLQLTALEHPPILIA